MVYRKALIKDDGLGSLNKTLNSRCNCGYKFKWISIKKI